MEKLEISKGEYILAALYMLNEYKERRAVSLEEADRFEEKIKLKLGQQGFEVGYPSINIIDVSGYCDYIMIDDERFVYRLKPMINHLDILNILNLQVKNCILEDESLLEGLNDYTSQEESEIKQFQVVDKAYCNQIMAKIDNMTQVYNAEICRLQELLENINKRRK